ncbi:MAG TPA: hypothetical protein VLA19_05260 [Herpetosiphonaceae bacterium]|nr:hypothetical protein [Herpetosiphonaceae bacterium]
MLPQVSRMDRSPARRAYITYSLIAALALLLVGQVAVYRLQQPARVAHPVWNFQPKNFAEAKNRAQHIVLAEVVNVERGEDLVTEVKGEPNDEDRLPTQKVTLKVTKGYKGTANDGTITLFQTGGEVQNPPPPAEGEKAPIVQGSEVVFAGDPLYKVGEQYLLLLESGPRDMQRIVSPEGRYKVERNGTLTAMVDTDAAREVKGKSLADVERQHGLGNGR